MSVPQRPLSRGSGINVQTIIKPEATAAAALREAICSANAERCIALYDRMRPLQLPTFTRIACSIEGCKKRGIHKVPGRGKYDSIYFCSNHREEGIRAKRAWNLKHYGPR
jgi:hypothetical protein